MTVETNKLRGELNAANRRQHDLETQVKRTMDFLLELNRLKELSKPEIESKNMDLSVRLVVLNQEHYIRVPFDLLSEANIEQLICVLESIHDQLHDENKRLVEAMEVFRKLLK